MLLDLRVRAVGEKGVGESTLCSESVWNRVVVAALSLSLSSPYALDCQVLTACVCDQFNALEILEVWVGFDVKFF